MDGHSATLSLALKPLVPLNRHWSWTNCLRVAGQALATFDFRRLFWLVLRSDPTGAELTNNLNLLPSTVTRIVLQCRAPSRGH